MSFEELNNNLKKYELKKQHCKIHNDCTLCRLSDDDKLLIWHYCNVPEEIRRFKKLMYIKKKEENG